MIYLNAISIHKEKLIFSVISTKRLCKTNSVKAVNLVFNSIKCDILFSKLEKVIK